ncbi:hypothetical protein PGT21_032456 [Puccinia graminis f. sp. tritici]|uniref:N-acetyltransferase domain-containing protein n=2 Tax=Puccinia graminis f. sp. tritici TaxID=56615 RepID=E3L0Q7_PUCGT|nr:uncharacterized protein PGTG_15959 [Puccinia graminis f. sp. tritici CRL 75-36-700-3]EFP90111.2 hypothetical protein PGTG_15959 [Puccinia graminis f. sp. tritici CRL 75-36-700-3]KAA1078279.1 hypothetical protein PGT21_032456 [Puccinia graminis f. sp. tritici]
MRVNEQTAIIGPRVVLVPYRKEHVPQYHEWMSDQELRESTASEPLSLQEEYEMCERWALDQDKLTFIIFARNPCLSRTSDQPAGYKSYSDYLGQMIGDVNLFISPDESSDSTAAETAQSSHIYKGELEIMIASAQHRKLGLATEALQLFISYIQIISLLQSHSLVGSTSYFPTLSFFFVKIAFSNTISQGLFEKLGFEKKITNKIFEEHEYRLNFSESAITITIDRKNSLKQSEETDEILDDQAHREIRVYESKWKDNNPIQMAVVPCPM